VPSDQESRSWYLRVTWVGLVLVVSLAIADAVLAPTPAPNHPDFIDTILASRAVVAAIRVTIVFAAGFIVLSVVALIARRQWVTRVGPVEVSDRVSDLNQENCRLNVSLKYARQDIERLEQELAVTDHFFDERQV
jgi:hypothetical protein